MPIMRHTVSIKIAKCLPQYAWLKVKTKIKLNDICHVQKISILFTFFKMLTSNSNLNRIFFSTYITKNIKFIDCFEFLD